MNEAKSPVFGIAGVGFTFLFSPQSPIFNAFFDLVPNMRFGVSDLWILEVISDKTLVFDTQST